jgi:hypothetical protein
MQRSLIELADALPADQWRSSTPFSDEIAACHQVIFAQGATEDSQLASLESWIARWQVYFQRSGLHRVAVSGNDVQPTRILGF